MPVRLGHRQTSSVCVECHGLWGLPLRGSLVPPNGVVKSCRSHCFSDRVSIQTTTDDTLDSTVVLAAQNFEGVSVARSTSWQRDTRRRSRGNGAQWETECQARKMKTRMTPSHSHLSVDINAHFLTTTPRRESDFGISTGLINQNYWENSKWYFVNVERGSVG